MRQPLLEKNASQDYNENQTIVASRTTNENHYGFANQRSPEIPTTRVSHLMIGNQRNNASHKNYETHEDGASQGISEDQVKDANHGSDENQTALVNHECIEIQSKDASHESCENQTEGVSHANFENQLDRASHNKFETPGSDVSHAASETHRTPAPEPEGGDLENDSDASGEAPDSIRAMVDLYYDLQKSRIALGNRIDAIDRNTSTETDKEKLQIKKVFERALELEKLLIPLFNSYVAGKPGSVFLLNTKGIGPVLSANLIATFGDCSKFATISNLWAWCGYAAVHVQSECSEGHKLITTTKISSCIVRVGDEKKLCAHDIIKSAEINKPPKRKAGYVLFINSKAKVILWKIGESFVKQSAGKSLYRAIYDESKARYLSRPELCSGKGWKGHIHSMSKRRAVKIFLEHFWVACRNDSGQSVSQPWIIGKGNHEHYVTPL